jgi:hypothetical protein
MSDDKDSGKSGGWSPSINQLLLVLLAGTLFVTQSPYHDSRPDNSKDPGSLSSDINAKPWQDGSVRGSE